MRISTNGVGVEKKVVWDFSALHHGAAHESSGHLTFEFDFGAF